MRDKKGFTLIELLAVIIILGVLMLIAIPSVTEYISSSRKSGYINNAREIMNNSVNGEKTKLYAIGFTSDASGSGFSGIVSRAKNLVPLLVPLFVSAFRRAEDLAMAMEARCYRGGYNRTKMKQSVITKSDYIASCILIIYLVIIIVTRFI